MKSPCEREFEKWWNINFKDHPNHPAKKFGELVWAVSWGVCYALVKSAIRDEIKMAVKEIKIEKSN